jgi:acyl carrier protein
MTRKEIKDIVIEKIRECDSNFIDQDITEDSTFDEIGMDSLDCVELLMKVEQHFNIGIPDSDMDDMRENPLSSFIDYLVPIVG